MKKILLALAVVATVACFSSCSKTCTCKTPTGSFEYKLDDLNTVLKQAGFKEIDKCSDPITWEGAGSSLETGWTCE